MSDPAFDCGQCKQLSAEMFFDKRYKQSICRSCFLDRRLGAQKALDSDWFLANVPFDQLTATERLMTGISSQQEYDEAKLPAEDESGGSTRDLRGAARPKQH